MEEMGYLMAEKNNENNEDRPTGEVTPK